jgi:hypothetical protein
MHRCAHYLEALAAFAARRPRRAMVPGHKAGAAADGGLRAPLGDRPVRARPADADRRRRRPGLAVRGGAAARHRGVGRAAHVVPHQRRVAGQPRRVPGDLAARRARRRAADRARQHDRRSGPRGPAAGVRRARGRRGPRHRALREPRRARRGTGGEPGRRRGDRRLAHLGRSRSTARRRSRCCSTSGSRRGRPRASRRRWPASSLSARTRELANLVRIRIIRIRDRSFGRRRPRGRRAPRARAPGR